MAIFLLDTPVIIDAINGKRGRGQLLDDLLAQRNLPRLLPNQRDRGVRGHAPPAKPR